MSLEAEEEVVEEEEETEEAEWRLKPETTACGQQWQEPPLQMAQEQACPAINHY